MAESAIFASIEEAVNELKAGRLIVVVDDEHRENEGDLMVAAEFCTPGRSTSWPGSDAV